MWLDFVVVSFFSSFEHNKAMKLEIRFENISRTWPGAMATLVRASRFAARRLHVNPSPAASSSVRFFSQPLGNIFRDPGAVPDGEFLDKYGIDLTKLAKQNVLDPVIGRDDEIRQTLQILSRRRKNNPMLIGEAGVGKTAILEGLAVRIVNGDVPSSMANKRIVSLDMTRLALARDRT